MNFTTAIPFIDPFPFETSNIVLPECVLGILLNSLLLIVILQKPIINIRRRGCLTIISLALADLTSSIGGMGLCFYTIKERQDPANRWPVKSLLCIVHVGFSASFLMLFLLSVEVYIITKRPLTTHIILTRRKILIAIVSLWLVSLVIGSCNFWTEDYPFLALSIVLVLLEFSVMAVTIFRIMVVYNIRRNRREVTDLMPSGSKSNNSGLTASFLILFFVYLVTAFPYLVVEQVHFLYHLKPEWNISFDHAAISYTLVFVHVNYFINPIIYAYRMPHYRQDLISLFVSCCKTKRKSNVPNTPSSDKRTFEVFNMSAALRASNENNSINV
ncbi:adenosine receptor A3-like [Xenia sp. Carnegie-2017]|uniref:adenosine receptor A3-like n=1 Tax=Xenia sp. Carnegie-2017 TaxID=2897299 RepID=UPI001F047D23|nr:adenosine receptor A3-like [Xenia sp. Carnegie-2017]